MAGRGNRKIQAERIPGLYASFLLGRAMAALAREEGVSAATMRATLVRFESEQPEVAEQVRASVDVGYTLTPAGGVRHEGECPAEPERVKVRLCGGEIADRWKCGACGRVLKAGRPRQCGRCGTIVRWAE